MHSASLPSAPSEQPRGRILLIDDEPKLLTAYSRLLRQEGYAVDTALDGSVVMALLGSKEFDVVVSDICMPGMNGIEVLRLVHEQDPDLPVVLMTGGGDLPSAVEAVEHGAHRYLIKPLDTKLLTTTVDNAVRLRHIGKLRRRAIELYGDAVRNKDECADLTSRFDNALATLTMAYQPIVSWSTQSIFSYEALVRTEEPSLRRPDHWFAAAETLGRVHELGRRIRQSIASTVRSSPTRLCVFVNLHPLDLLDDDLFSADAPLSAIAGQVILEVTERSSLDRIDDLRGRLAALRKLEYRVALDDLGAGYAGLNSFAQIEPQAVKLDMALVRDVDKQPTKRLLISSMVTLCKELGILVVAEGVETILERDALVALGCDLLQGYLFAKPSPPFPVVDWDRVGEAPREEDGSR